ncbi:ATP-binding cassette subfamily B protein [Hungatella effluvii]|uniref:ATP-binding cassette subfamily B protein n=1 Tax=Hungatella effluvii TaxID=1096246 RepID=A0A2V3YB27_9FIRM|nr:ABC transporter ATP-binding protein [Hungatella effluvii]PXX55823.1 ATP-binding cassette subfamily B protein [Hungatella effluvii]
MSKYLQKKFALSGQGGKDLTKAIFCCALTNISLMFPMGILFLFMERLTGPLVGLEAPDMGIGGYVGISVVLLAVIGFFECLQYNATFLSSYQESANMRIRLAERLRMLPLSFFGKRDLADLTTTIMADCAFVEKAFSHFIPELIGALISTVLIGVGLLATNWRMGIAVLWVAPVSFLLAALTRPLVDRMERRQKGKKIAASDGIQECIENIQDIRANNQSADYLKKLDQKIMDVESITVKLELLNGTLVTSAQMILKIGMATTVLVGASLLVSGSISFMIFLMFMLAATRLYQPLSGCLQNLSAVYSTLLVVERMKSIEEQKIQQGREDAAYRGYDIVFDRVGFSYKEGEPVLREVSFTARQGQVTALVGPSGGGKSTSAKLAARFWDIDKGTITIGGSDISKIEPETLLKSFSIVFQDVVLFNNTIMENIRLGRKGASDEEVLAAARAAQCEEFISRLPEGYQTRIGENGSTLSGGERQRLSIARALLKDAPIILMDEATASLDVENETLVQEAISNLVKDKTVLIIAHRMRTVAGADQIVVLKDGCVAEQGTPEKLLEDNGIYRHMTELQNRSLSWSL